MVTQVDEERDRVWFVCVTVCLLDVCTRKVLSVQKGEVFKKINDQTIFLVLCCITAMWNAKEAYSRRRRRSWTCRHAIQTRRYSNVALSIGVLECESYKIRQQKRRACRHVQRHFEMEYNKVSGWWGNKNDAHCENVRTNSSKYSVRTYLYKQLRQTGTVEVAFVRSHHIFTGRSYAWS